MTISIFELFSVGIGPSSSHTVGPMRAAKQFIDGLQKDTVDKIIVDLYGSLALTGKGHGTDNAILMGLLGEKPEEIEPSTIDKRVEAIKQSQQLSLSATHTIHFSYNEHLNFHMQENLPLHANGMRFRAFSKENKELAKQIYYSIGGGFIVIEEDFDRQHDLTSHSDVPYPFSTAQELLKLCNKNKLSIAELMLENEKTWRNTESVKQGILHIAQVMKESINNGCHHEGILPGILKVPRRAPALYKKLQAQNNNEFSNIINHINLYALAVNEENAAGGRVVTAPTNGAAGIIPAVMLYYEKFYNDVTDSKIIEFLLTAAAIAILYKKGASISAAEVGCQGEVGVACSMAAGALTAVLGGSIEKIENAAEIGMEHHLGLTCDPVAGLVQIPCIERNAMGATQAITASQLALMGEGKHHISLDEVIATMLKTGKDMQTRYKETSLGGLATIGLPEC